MKIDRTKFYSAYRREFGGISQDQVDALNFLLAAIENDADLTDLRQIAYCLATTYHETARTFRPVAEIGKGRGRVYGKPDPSTGQTYYGRGYVQLTWKKNYQRFAVYLGVDLVNNPDLAMEAESAYRIMSYGMRKGSFTGKALSEYINSTHCDYVGARKIINGTDRAQLIASYAVKFEGILRSSGLQD